MANVPFSTYGHRVINIKSKGAVGNGTTDDTAAFTAATAEAASTGYPIYVPPTAAFYRVTSTPVVPDGVTIFGDGWHSKIKQTVREMNVLALGNYCTARGLHIIGDNSEVLANAQLNNGIIAVGKRGVTIQGNFIEKCESSSIHIAQCYDVKILHNTCFGYTWNNTVNGGSSADILLYGGAAGARILIQGNHCLSNHSAGILVNTLGRENDVVIDSNICVTLDPTTCVEGGTWSEMVSPNRRHGITAAYNSNAVQCRTTITNNVCRNTRWSGIYVQSSDAVRGPVVVSNNFLSRNGINPNDPSLAGGIFVKAEGGELINGNFILDYQYPGPSASGGLTVIATPDVPAAPSVITNNVVKNSEGLGCFITGKASKIVLRGNTFVGSAKEDVKWESGPSTVTGGGHLIMGNTCVRTRGVTYASMTIMPAQSADPVVIRDNFFLGVDNTTSANANTAILAAQVSGLSEFRTWIYGNHIRRFRYGVVLNNYISAGRHFDQCVDRNFFELCHTAIAVASTGTNATFPCEGNRFISCTNRFAAPLDIGGTSCGWDARRLGTSLEVSTASAAPSSGSWSAGDRCWFTTVSPGAAPGAVCTSAGTPGTWKAMASLAA